MSFKVLEGQMARWLEILGTYDYEVVYHPGAKHGNADALSRKPWVVVSVDFATESRQGASLMMIRSVVQLQGMEVGNVI